MKGIELKRARYVLAAILACLITLAGIGIAHTVNAAGATATVTYDLATDKLTVKNGTTPYKFYTTTAATKTVPAPNKWMKTNAGVVDVSGVTAGATLYFANSTAPSLDEIAAVKVPASPALVSAVYKPSATTMDEMFVFKTNVKVAVTTETENTKTGKVTTKTAQKTMAIVVPHSRIEVKLNDNGTWQDFDKAITAAQLEIMQRDSAVIYARIKQTTKVKIAADESGAYQFTDDGTTKVTIPDETTVNKNVQTTKVYDTSSLVRYGTSKVIKIARKAAGPAVAIDYASHAMTVKKGQSYGTATAAATDPTTWNTPDKTEKVYFGTTGSVSKAEYYAVKTSATAKAPDSLLTYLDIPVDVAFATTSKVDVSGGYGENATMKITNTAGTKGVAYQYAIVDLADGNYSGLITSTGVFDYSNPAVKWTNVKTGADGTVNVALAWAKVNGKQVLVRKAAVGTTFSSKVVALNAPGTKGAPAVFGSTAVPISVGCWTMLAQDKYGAGFTANNKNIVFCPYVSVTYVGNGLFEIYVYGGKAIANNVQYTAQIGKKLYVVDYSGEKKAVDQTNNYKITGIKLTDLPVNNANKVTFIFPDGFATASYAATDKTTTNVQSVSQTVTVTADTKKPVIKTAVIKGTDLLLTFDSQISIGGTPVDIVNQTVTNNKNIASSIATTTLTLGTQFTCTAYNKKTGVTTISIPYTVKAPDTKNEKMTVTLTGFKDIAGNDLESTTIECANPAYSY